MSSGAVVARLSRSDVQQRVIRVPRAPFLPEDVLFDVWHDGVPWGVKIRSEPCECGRPPQPHRHRYIEGGELHVGVEWVVGAEITFVERRGRVEVEGVGG